jgi:alkanesulfonate monooxygenase SsuD/methylene tetrahydromethanopterin reductase-like flavin-dependent oxidoreductase (luciferase family)
MTISAGIGIANYLFDDAKGFWRWVAMCDAEGVDSLWQSDRLIGKDPSLECLSVMGALAGATRRIKFGMNVASMALRDPIVTARACATIDVLSEGRLLPMLGVGTARSRDFSATGRPTKGRGQRAGEGIQIMSRLWAGETLSFAGRFYQLNEASIAPLPLQQPLPLWVGGAAAAAIERTARWGTGWQAGIETPDEIAPVIAAIKMRATELGRQIDEDHFGAGFGFRFGSPDDDIVKRQREALARRISQGTPEDYTAIGSADDIMALLQRFHAAGAHKFILRPIASGTEDIIAQTRRLIDEVLPRVKAMNH